MHTITDTSLISQTWDNEVLAYVAAIYKEAGKTELYVQHHGDALEKLVPPARLQSTVASESLAGLTTSNSRVLHLVTGQIEPRNLDERELMGYYAVIPLMTQDLPGWRISKKYIVNLHKALYSYTHNPVAGLTKTGLHAITDTAGAEIFLPVTPYETPKALDDLCAAYTAVNGQVNPLVAISAFLCDFLSIHPFDDGNGRVSRLLLSRLLWDQGFCVGKYISLEEKLRQTQAEHDAALRQAQQGWHEGTNDTTPYVKYMLHTLLSAYEDLNARCATMGEKLPAIETIRSAVAQRQGDFKKRDIMEMCPALSLSTVEGALRELVRTGEIERYGVGRAITYRKTM